MKQISLKWRIFLFYLVFGLLPLGVISYLSVAAYSRSINTITDRYVTELVQRIGDQTNNLGYIHYNYLDLLAKSPYVQLSFLQFPGGKLNTIRDKLELFRINTASFSRLSLYSNDGQMVATTPAPTVKTGTGVADPDRILRISRYNYFHQEDIGRNPERILFYKRVYDFRDPERPVGLISAEVHLSKFLVFIKDLSLGGGIQKSIFNQKGIPIFNNVPRGFAASRGIREYSADLSLLNWKIVLRIPEHLLMKDVNRLAYKILAIAGFVAVVAIIASLAFSRRAIKPLQQIIAGTKAFASGDLDHRVKIPYGVETKRVAEAFNSMASALQSRQSELVRAGKLASLGLLSAGFAHEVRNPLAGLKTSAQVLERRSPSFETKRLARGISKEVDRLNAIVTDLLHFARPQPAERVPCRLSEIVEKSLGLIKNEIDLKHVTVDNRVEDRVVFAAVDHMLQVLINLLLNALEAVAPESGSIRLSSGLNPMGEPFLLIRDNGHGIPAEKISRIFDPFFSLSEKGTGLGLSIVHSLLKQNDAKIEVDSREGEGTAVTLVFKAFNT